MVMVAGVCVCVCVCVFVCVWRSWLPLVGQIGAAGANPPIGRTGVPLGRLVLLALCSNLGYWQVLGGRIAGVCVDYSCGWHSRLGFLAFVCIGLNALPWAWLRPMLSQGLESRGAKHPLFDKRIAGRSFLAFVFTFQVMGSLSTMSTRFVTTGTA